MSGRVVVWFSCGAASAVAAYKAIEKYGHERTHLVYCDTLKNEHPDNSRFLGDVQRWLEHKVEIIASEKYSGIEDVFEKRRYMSGVAGAICTVELKKVPRYEFQEHGDIHIFGLTSDEGSRIRRFQENNPNLQLDWILRDSNISKAVCYKILKYTAEIALPVMYSLGFKNNNCIGCVKSTSVTYWTRVRRLFPEVFQSRAEQSRRLDVRLVRLHGKRIFLDELPTDATDNTPEEDIECGPVCLIERERTIRI